MIEVLEKGLHTSVQDTGRFGYRNFGVPVSGVMDAHHAAFANQLLGNDANAALLEITLQGPKLRFHEPTQIVICGADLSPQLNNAPLRMNFPVQISNGDLLTFGSRNYGVRTYLGVKNGFQTPIVMKSRSFYEGITQNSVLQTGDTIPYEATIKNVSATANIALSNTFFQQKHVNVYEGPEFHLLSKQQQAQLFQAEFTIGLNNRMAYQLQECVENHLESIITSAVLPGTVQLTPSGRLLILMNDCQTTGGYPRILQLDEIGRSKLAQTYTHEKIHFTKISIS